MKFRLFEPNNFIYYKKKNNNKIIKNENIFIEIEY